MPRESLVRLVVLKEMLAVCRLAAGSAVPHWAFGDGFRSVTATADELSVICEQTRVPRGVRSDRDWRALQLVGPFDFSAVGVLLPVAEVLAAERISMLPVATFDTDYVLVKDNGLARARRALEAAGHEVRDGR